VAKWLSGDFSVHINQEVLSLCTCWLITLKDGRRLGFTNFNRALTIAGVTYRPEGGFKSEASKSTHDATSTKQTLYSYFDSDLISVADLVGGEYDGAQIQIFSVNWAQLPSSLEAQPYQYCPRIKGGLGEISTDGQSFTAQMVGRLDQYNDSIAALTSRFCRNELGDSKCKKPLNTLTYWVQVVAITDRRTFTVDALAPAIADYFGEGELLFWQGKNHQAAYQINNYSAQRVVTLYEPVRNPLAVGDWVRLIAGCRKRFEQDCKTKFNNVLNFGGEPHIPGWDSTATGSGSASQIGGQSGNTFTPPPEVPQPG
jgi:uncharacterized phage protein (TIGR02218 family)